MVINPIVGVYIPITRIPIKGGMTIPNIATLDHGTYGCQPKSRGKTPKSSIWIGVFPCSHHPFCWFSQYFWKRPYIQRRTALFSKKNRLPICSPSFTMTGLVVQNHPSPNMSNIFPRRDEIKKKAPNSGSMECEQLRSFPLPETIPASLPLKITGWWFQIFFIFTPTWEDSQFD